MAWFSSILLPFKPSMRPASSKFSDMGNIIFMRCYLSLTAMCRPCWAGVGTHAPLLLGLLWTFPWSHQSGKMCPGKFRRFWESEISVRYPIFFWSNSVFEGLRTSVFHFQKYIWTFDKVGSPLVAFQNPFGTW